MKTPNLFSIGHGHKAIEEFISELQSFNIQFLIDVRSSPFSKWAPEYNQGVIEKTLNATNLRYVYMGDSIGGRPQNNDCYDSEGRFDYRKMALVPTFKQGLQRLVMANEKNCRVAVMCSETDPSECHRSKLIGRELYFNFNINMCHIVSQKETILETKIIEKLTNNSWSSSGDLFGLNEPPYFKSRNIYKKEAEYEEIYD